MKDAEENNGPCKRRLSSSLYHRCLLTGSFASNAGRARVFDGQVTGSLIFTTPGLIFQKKFLAACHIGCAEVSKFNTGLRYRRFRWDFPQTVNIYLYELQVVKNIFVTCLSFFSNPRNI
jgi:hypothetical protein